MSCRPLSSTVPTLGVCCGAASISPGVGIGQINLVYEWGFPVAPDLARDVQQVYSLSSCPGFVLPEPGQQTPLGDPTLQYGVRRPTAGDCSDLLPGSGQFPLASLTVNGAIQVAIIAVWSVNISATFRRQRIRFSAPVSACIWDSTGSQQLISGNDFTISPPAPDLSVFPEPLVPGSYLVSWTRFALQSWGSDAPCWS